MSLTTDNSSRPRTIPEALARFENSKQTALVCGSQRLSYRDMLSDAQRVARMLTKRGVRKGDRVVQDMSRSADYIRVYLGILYAGAVSVTVHSGWPEQQRLRAVSDCEPVLTIDDAAARELIETPPDKDDDGRVLPKIQGSDPFQILYTSGSTGEPKGVVNCHQLAVSILTDREDSGNNALVYRYFSDNSQRVLMDANLAFTLASGLIFRAFLYGKTLILTTEEEMESPGALAACIRRTGADTLHGISSCILQSLKDPDYSDALSGMKKIMFVGEMADEKVLDALGETGAELRYVYGSTETSICMFSPPLHRGEEIRYDAPFRDLPVWVLEEGGNGEVSPGSVGEICVGGTAGQYGCYWNNPELTAEKYIDHPAFGRLLRTGDLAQREKDGRIRILGRKDSMTKLHGQRIELGAVETAMEAFPGIRRAAARIQGEGASAMLCGYYSVEEKPSMEQPCRREDRGGRHTKASGPDSVVDQGALRRALAQSLPCYMVPALLMELPQLPLNVNGKLDRHALPPVRGMVEYAAPKTETEKQLCRTFAQVLELDSPVGLDDSFFALGGDSIRGMAVVVLLREQGLELKMEWLFAAPTVRLLAPMLLPLEKRAEKEEILWSAKLTDEEWDCVQRAVPGENVETVYPLLRGVNNFFQSENPGWMCKAFLMDEPFTLAELRRRLEESVRCHQTMRSVFVRGNAGRSFQVVLKEWKPPVFSVDLRGLASSDAGAEKLSDAQKRYLLSLYRLLIAKPFSCSEVMFEAGLVRISDSRCILVLACSHLLQDGPGYALIQEEVAFGARAVSDVRQYNRYLHRLMSAEYAEKCRREWHKIAPSCRSVITALPSEPGTGKGTRAQRFVAGSAFARRAQSFCAERNITYASMVCCALGRTIMSMCGLEEAGFFSSSSGRDVENVRLTGMFTGGIPVLVTEADTPNSVQERLVRLSCCPPPDLEMLGHSFEKPAQGCFVGVSMQNFLYKEKKEDLFQGILASVPAQEKPAVGGKGLVDPRSIMIMVEPEASFQILVVSDLAYDAGGKLAGSLGRGMLTQLRRLVDKP